MSEVSIARLWEVPELMPDSEPPESESRKEEDWFEEGYQRGYDEGVAETRAHFEQLLADEQARVTSLESSLLKASREIDADTIVEMAQLSAAVAAQVIRTELVLQPEVIAKLIEDVVSQVPAHHGMMTVALHPEDYTVMSAMTSRWSEAFAAQCRFVEEKQLERGNCRVWTEHSVVNADLHERVDQIVDASLTSLLD